MMRDKTGVTDLTACELVAALAAGTLSSVEVVEAHIERVEEVEPVLNAVVARRYDRARDEAREADRARARGEGLGVLHGLPVTVKDQFDVAGFATSFGVERLASRPVATDGAMVAGLRRAGAVVIAKSNVPQSLGVYETVNDTFGRTNNPWDLSRTPGGSSGGEAALVACGASPLGLGADFGGSLRVPSAWCGVATLKPTARRLPTDPAPVRTASGQEGIVAQAGPIARTVADVSLGLRVMVDAVLSASGAIGPPVPWREPDLDVVGLRVAVLEQVDDCPPAAAVRRALIQSAESLRAVGAQVETWPHSAVTDKASALMLQLVSADGFAFARQVIGDDARHPIVKGDLAIMSAPRPVLHLIRAVMRSSGQYATARLLSRLGRTSAAGLMDLLGDRLASEAAVIGALDSGDYDVLLCPALPIPAPPHDLTSQLPHVFASISLFNVLGLPAGVLPVTTVRHGEEAQAVTSRDRCEQARVQAEQGTVGLPVGVQIAARPWREDLVLATMAAIEEGVRGMPGYPSTPIAVDLS